MPSELCTDSEFLRRVSLDLTGTLPAPEEVNAFLADPSPGKRAAKVEELLRTPAYAGWWTTRLCDYTGNSPRGVNVGGNLNRQPGEFSRQWYQWLYKRVADNTPYDQIVAGIVLATSRSSPEQSYKDYTARNRLVLPQRAPRRLRATTRRSLISGSGGRRGTPQEKALAFTHAFMGVRLECAQCHKHPFDRWTKRDFEQFTAFFTPIVSGPRSPPQGGKGNKEGSKEANKDKGGQAAPVTAGPAEEMTYRSLTQEITREIKEKVTHEHRRAGVATQEAAATPAEGADRRDQPPDRRGRAGAVARVVGGQPQPAAPVQQEQPARPRAARPRRSSSAAKRSRSTNTPTRASR